MDMIRTDEAAERSGVAAPSITAAIRRGVLPAKKEGGQWYISPEDFERWLTDPLRRPGRKPKEADDGTQCDG